MADPRLNKRFYDMGQKQLNKNAGVIMVTGNLSDDRAIIREAIRDNNIAQLRQLQFSPNVNKDAVLYEMWDAAVDRNVEAVRALVRVPGLNINYRNYHGRTLLNVVAGEGYTEIVRLLLTVPGISIYISDNAGMTPVNRAAMNGHTDIVRMLTSGSYN